MKFLLVLIVLGALVYLLVRLVPRGTLTLKPGRRPKRPSAPPQQRRVIAPDDDPDFLRDLERKRRRKRQDDDADT